MVSRKCVPVFDHVGRRVLFHKTQTQALQMVDAGVAFVLSNDPLEVAFTNAPTSSDRSLTLSRSVVVGAARGSKCDQEAVRSRRTIQMFSKKEKYCSKGSKKRPTSQSFLISTSPVPEKLLREPAGRAILYFPEDDRTTKGTK